MTINGCELARPTSGDADLVRDAVVGYLVKLGYELKGRSAQRAHLKYEGTVFTTNPERLSHHVYVSSKPGVIHFEFSTGIVASYWTEKDIAFAEARADSAMRAAHALLDGIDDASAPEEAMRPCRWCGKINPISALACTCCGAAQPR